MTRKQTYGFAAIAAAALSVGGAWSLVHAQQVAPGGAPTANPIRPNPNQPGAAGRMGSSGLPGMGGNMSRMMGPSGMMGSGGMGAGMGGGMVGGMIDPEMAEFAEAEGTLAAKADDLLAQYATADAPDDQKQLKDELRDTLAKQFDVQRERRELELQRIEVRVQKLRDQIKKRNDARDTIIDRRFEQLIDEADGLGWGPPTSADVREMPRAPRMMPSTGKKSQAGAGRQ